MHLIKINFSAELGSRAPYIWMFTAFMYKHKFNSKSSSSTKAFKSTLRNSFTAKIQGLMLRIENCLGTCVYLTSHCVLILAVNVKFQIELDSPIFKANFLILKKLRDVFNIPLLPNVRVQITAIIDQSNFTPQTRKQILGMTRGVYFNNHNEKKQKAGK